MYKGRYESLVSGEQTFKVQGSESKSPTPSICLFHPWILLVRCYFMYPC